MINFLRSKEKKGEAAGKEWDSVSKVEFGGMRTSAGANAPVSAMSPDVARMQESLRKMQEIQAAREKVMKSFDKNFDKMNRAAGVDRFRGNS